MFLFKRISMLMLSISCCFASLQADFITLSVWERTTPSGEKQHVICCGDIHNLNSKADEQTNDVVGFLAERNCSSDCILIEDTCDFGHTLAYAKEYFKWYMDEPNYQMFENVQTRYNDELKEYMETEGKGVILNIGPQAESLGIRIINCEYRQVFGWLPIPNPWQPLVCKIRDFMWGSIFEELKAYDDGNVLNHFYQDIITAHDKLKYVQFINKPLMNGILDAKLLHNIYQLQVQQEQSNLLVVCAGAWHILNIERVLPRLNYICIHKEPIPHTTKQEISFLSIFQGINNLTDPLATIKKRLTIVDAEKKALASAALMNINSATGAISPLCLSQKFQNAVDQQAAKKQARIEKRIKQIFSGLDDNIMLDLNLNMHTDTLKSPAKLQAKL